MVLRFLIGNTTDRTITTERVKLLAGGCQLVAVGTLIASNVAPFFNPNIIASFSTEASGGIGFAILELLALRIMGYIPITKEE